MFRNGKNISSFLGVFVGILTIISFIVSSTGVEASEKAFQSNPILNLTDETFKQEVESPEAGVVLVEFWGPWCGICKKMSPILDSVNQQLGNQVKIGKVDISENPQLMFRFEIERIPTLMVFKNGEKMASWIGYKSKEQLLEWIANYL